MLKFSKSGLVQLRLSPDKWSFGKECWSRTLYRPKFCSSISSQKFTLRDLALIGVGLIYKMLAVRQESKAVVVVVVSAVCCLPMQTYIDKIYSIQYIFRYIVRTIFAHHVLYCFIIYLCCPKSWLNGHDLWIYTCSPIGVSLGLSMCSFFSISSEMFILRY